jgi:long-chain fatty acid transport protein
MKHRITVLLLLVLAVVTCALATNGVRMMGYNAATVGRGGTGIGVFDQTSVMMTNPAGLSFLNGPKFGVDFSLMIPALKFTNSLNDVEGKTNYFPLPGLSYADAGESGLGWGIGLFTQGGMGADFNLKHALYRNPDGSYNLQEYHSKLAVMQGGPSISYKLTPQLSIGVSAHVVYSMLEFTMPYSLSPSIMKGVVNPTTGMTFGMMFSAPAAQGGFGYTEVTASAAMKDLTAFGFAGKIGLAYALNDKVTLGLSYSSPSTLTFKNGKATMDMTAQLNDAFGKAMAGYMAQNPTATQQQAQTAIMTQFTQLGIDMTKGVAAAYDLELGLTLPQSIGFGIGYKATDALTLSADVEWVNWKSAFDKMSLTMSNGSNANVNRMLGNSGAFSMDFPMDWKDAMTFRVGGKYNVTSFFTLSAGYAYGSNPVPESTIFPVFPAIVENHATIGATLNILPGVGISAAYEMAFNKSQKASTPSVIATEYSASTSQLSENIFHVSLGWVLK